MAPHGYGGSPARAGCVGNSARAGYSLAGMFSRMHDADEVWNRALEYEKNLSAQGDRALRDLLTFHGSVQNGGLVDAVANYAEDAEFPVVRVIDAYRYFGMEAMAALISECLEEHLAVGEEDWDAAERLELRFDPQYTVDDEDLTAPLRNLVATSPGDFAPTG